MYLNADYKAIVIKIRHAVLKIFEQLYKIFEQLFKFEQLWHIFKQLFNFFGADSGQAYYRVHISRLVRHPKSSPLV